MNYNDHNPITEHKCAWCDKIAPRNDSCWQFAANLPFHYVCSDKCAAELKDYLEEKKEAKKEAAKKLKQSKV